MDTVLQIIDTHRETDARHQVSLLDPALEIALRRRMPHGVRVFTGDDYNYVDLIVGDGTHTSDASSVRSPRSDRSYPPRSPASTTTSRASGTSSAPPKP